VAHKQERRGLDNITKGRATHQSSAKPPLLQGNSRVLAEQDIPDHTSHMLLTRREARLVPPVHIGTLEGKPGALANEISADIGMGNHEH
jgi:hypothetical protein